MLPAQHIEEAHRIFDEEIQALQAAKAKIGNDFTTAVEIIAALTGKVVVCGIGKSGIVGHKIAATLASTGTSAVYLNAGEALHGDLGMVDAKDTVVMLSNSAATAELIQMLPSIKAIGAKIIGIFGRSETPLAEACDVILDAKVEREACPLGLAPMSSSTVALVLGDALASALMKQRGFKQEQFAVYHPGGSLGRRLLLRVRDVMHPVGDGAPVVGGNMMLRDALKVMSSSNLGGLIIAEEDILLGVFTDGDLRRKIVEGCSLDSAIVELMTKNPISVMDDMRLGEALDLMESNTRRIYFVPVLNEEKKLCGALRMHDVVAG